VKLMVSYVTCTCIDISNFFRRKIYQSVAISGYQSKELSNVNMLHESDLRRKSRTSEQYRVSVYHVFL
jgi:hypothetical protein